MTRKNRMFQKDVAAALGISASMVTRLKQQGMPTNSIAGAKRWRETNLSPNLTKGVRASWATEKNSENFGRAESVERAELIALLAETDFEKWESKLRAALRAVPHQQREQVMMPRPVWTLLTAPVMALLDELDSLDPPTEPSAVATVDDPAGDPLPGVFMYLVAADQVGVWDPRTGEPRPQVWIPAGERLGVGLKGAL